MKSQIPNIYAWCGYYASDEGTYNQFLGENIISYSGMFGISRYTTKVHGIGNANPTYSNMPKGLTLDATLIAQDGKGARYGHYTEVNPLYESCKFIIKY